MHDDLALLQMMMDDMPMQKDIYRPGPYWEGYVKRTAATIGSEGLASFRSSAGVGKGYADVFVDDPYEMMEGRWKIIYGASRRLPLVGSVLKRKVESRARLNRRNHEKKNQRLSSALGDWMRGFEQTHDIPDTMTGDPQRRLSFADGEIGELYLRDFAWISDYAGSVDFSKVNSVFEIGGGFGSMAHTLLHMFPNIRKYLYLDIPPFLYVGTQYLKHFFGAEVRDYSQTRHLEEIKFSDTDDREIIAICPWQIEKVKTKVDMFWNSSSFQEMTNEIVVNYARHIDGILGDNSNLCFFVYASDHATLTSGGVVNVLEETTSFECKEVNAAVIKHILPGSLYLGKRR